MIPSNLAVDVVTGSMVFIGMTILIFGLAKLAYVPLALSFSTLGYRRKRARMATYLDELPTVSVIVPGYNEEAVIENCVSSILASKYPHVEVILVDDGSTDATPRLMAELAASDSRVRCILQKNAGKGAALNHGLRESSGEVLLFVDADGIFGLDTIEQMLRGFNGPKVGAVCGDDRPVNLNTVQTRLLTVISHVGTGLVRRALTMLHCLPIVSGNAGAFRREVLELAGPLNEVTIGEDLELTWRIHKAGFRVNFAPRALVYAESPSTLKGLWKQRVRWARGLLQTLKIHRRMVGNPTYGIFGIYLAFNAINMVLIPLLQMFVLLAIPFLLLHNVNTLPQDAIALIAWLGLALAVALCLFSMALNSSMKDTRHLWTIPLWPLYSVFVGLTMLVALIQEIGGHPAKWNKLKRTGVVSIAR
ncbi:glycosyltransferase [Paeniglutamicibacter kerguelensis]|uniref:Cellulose synthase/poly-beta-1,6-N-acetylglucosamine synthase-like glycosyltransferase n=1 Tax=Paeniglutamicibacter kerguelensis TaxID=254788 RepID=A0ABS4X9F7_9MICC|nr:glycosyltransferase family 2 protein [Paeniglutamicibacter kerguelensis]MBP2385087.1 cellulose synthase/poly-beta-1,6-N-acetylglucosamine synthase-like glycosyltransferase [Paeniglutamicibacter kerguelensis]